MKRALPLCHDCVHCRPTAEARFNKCHAPQGRRPGAGLNGEIDPPTRWEYCSIQREDGWFNARAMNSCGIEGRWFEPKGTP